MRGTWGDMGRVGGRMKVGYENILQSHMKFSNNKFKLH